MTGLNRFMATFAMLGVVGVFAACGGEEEPRETPTAVAQPAGPSEAELAALRAEASQVFSDRCARCHGVSGAGNGIDSDNLMPPPRNFQDPGWQRSVRNAYLEQITVEGGPAVGKAESMPAHPDLASRPLLVVELRRYLRSFAH